MTSPFSTLFLSIQQRLKEQVPEIRFIEQDFGQLEMENPPVSFPCVLIDFADWQYEQMGENLQFASGSVNIRLAVEAWSNTNNLTPTQWRDKGLVFYDLEWKVYKALQTFQPNLYDALTRTSVQTERREDNLRVREISFTTGFQDMEAMPEHQETPLPPPEFSTELGQQPNVPPIATSPFKVKPRE